MTIPLLEVFSHDSRYQTLTETMLGEPVASQTTPKRRTESYCKATVSIIYQYLEMKT